MSRKILVSLLFLASLTTACGDSSSADGDDVKGPTVSSNDARGMVFAAVNVDPSLKNSRIYDYDFATGTVRELLAAESGDPAVFAVGDKVLLFNRQADAPKTMRVLDLKTAGAEPGSAVTLEGLADGDPRDVAPLSSSGSQALLASGLGSKLQLVDYASGSLTDVATPNLASIDIRPFGVHVSGSTAYIAHSGVEGLASGSGQIDGTQQLYVATVGSANPATFTFIDKTDGGLIDGLPLTASNPYAMVNRADDGATIVGLCSENLTGCVGGSDRLAGGSVAKLDEFAEEFGYEFFNTITDGPNTATVYAHVRATDGRYLVIKLNVETGVAITIHEFADERLYGLAYEPSSRTLFVGGVDGIKGTMTLYRDDVDVGSFQLDGMPYHAAFVAK